MAPATPRLRILSVGGNAVSAFLSWRLQATNACDVTLVWKSGYESVAQYGISFKSKLFGNQRFKPYAVVRSPEEAAQPSKAPFDYVLLCVKALPDVYDIAAIIEPVVSAQHTCILINTTSALGIESYLEQRFPTNVVLSLVSGAEIVQLGPSEFEHRDATDIWVGAANRNPSIPASIQVDMADALAMTLSSGQVDCQVSNNIRQQQYERMIGPIAFHPASVLFETPNHTELLEKVGVRELVTSVVNELLHLAEAQGCKFPADFREKTMEQMINQGTEPNSIMYQDFLAKRPMEVETYLGSPIKLAQEVKVTLPRVETLYALLHHLNQVNQTRQSQPASPTVQNGHPPRLSSAPTPRGPPPPMMNGQMNGQMKNGMGRGRMVSMNGPPPPPPGMRRGPPPPQGYPPRMANGNGYPPGGPPKNRRASFEGNDLEEFSHIMLYDSVPDGGLADAPNGVYDQTNPPQSTDELALRERELALRERELAIRNQEFEHRRRQQRRPPPPGSQVGGFDDDDDEDFFDPMAARQPMIDPENFDMLSVTSRRNRRTPSSAQLRQNPEMGGPPDGRGPRNMFKRPPNKNRTSARLIHEVPGLHDSIMNNALMGYSSNRYGAVDRQAMGQDSRSNSLTAARLNELERTGGGGYGAYPSMPSRRASQSPGNPFSPGQPRPGGRPSPPNGYAQANGMPPPGAGPAPPGMRQPTPRHPPGHGNAVAPQQVEQQVGVSHLYPNKPAQVRSLTGSASASAGSGDSSHSANLDSSENSAYSSQSSLGPRAAIGVR